MIMQVLVAEDSQLQWLAAERMSPLLEAVQKKCVTPKSSLAIDSGCEW